MKNQKITNRILILLAFITVNAFIIFGLAQLLHYLNTGADRASIFHQDATLNQYYAPQVFWEPLNNEGRSMEVTNKQRIEKNYLDAWYTRVLALNDKGVDKVENVYTEDARKNLLQIVAENSKNNIRIASTSLEHNITLDFYSADGKIVVFTDRNVHTYSATYTKADSFLFDTSEIADFKVIMLLEDGFWRIRHLEKIAVHKASKHASVVKSLPLSQIKGINYYPKSNPWNTFGEDFSSEETTLDFQLIKELGLQTIRVFIGYEDFGKADVSEVKLQRLNNLLDIAETNDIDVIITLFDFYGNYAVSDWTQTQQHATTIVSSIKNHPALQSWDVKNEPDLDFNSRDEVRVLAWLKRMIATIKKEDQTHPITIGWSNAEATKHLLDDVDYVSFHYYQDIKLLSDVYTSIAMRTDKTIVVQEFGLSTNRSLWNWFGNSEHAQYEYYQTFFKQQKRDSINYLFWTLYDFEKVPSEVAGPYPWVKNKQANFGIFDTSGVQKKATTLFQTHD